MIGPAFPRAAWAFVEGRVLATENSDPARETRANEPAIGFGHVSDMLSQLLSRKLFVMYKEAQLFGKFGIGIASGKLNPGSAKTLASATPRIRAPKCKKRGAPPQ